jgi:hypothetical protein
MLEFGGRVFDDGPQTEWFLDSAAFVVNGAGPILWQSLDPSAIANIDLALDSPGIQGLLGVP